MRRGSLKKHLWKSSTVLPGTGFTWFCFCSKTQQPSLCFIFPFYKGTCLGVGYSRRQEVNHLKNSLWKAGNMCKPLWWPQRPNCDDWTEHLVGQQNWVRASCGLCVVCIWHGNKELSNWSLEADSLFVVPCLYSLYIVCFKYIVCKSTGLAQNLKVAWF